MGEVILILGGARSGKSRLAERLAGGFAPVTYVATATATADDAEMSRRIARHRQRRPQTWDTKEIPRDLEMMLPALVARPGAVLIDCVTLWLTNLMLGLGGPALDQEGTLEAVERTAKVARGEANVIWVSNEVGSGIVPDNALARTFADVQGLANQALAAESDAAYLCVAGLPMKLK